MNLKLSFIAAAAILAVAPAHASTNLIQNGGFETTTLTRSNQFVNEVANWTNASTNGYTGYGYNFLIMPNTADSSGFYSRGGNHDYVYGPNTSTSAQNYAANGFTGTSPSGGNFLLLDSDPAFSGAVSQTVSGLTVGQTYTLTFDYAGIAYGTTPITTYQTLGVTFGNTTQSTAQLVNQPKGFTGWQTGTMNFTATSAQQTLSFLANGSPAGYPPSMFLDNISLTAAVPEPASWAMMIGGFGMVGGAMRRRRANIAFA